MHFIFFQKKQLSEKNKMGEEQLQFWVKLPQT